MSQTDARAVPCLSRNPSCAPGDPQTEAAASGASGAAIWWQRTEVVLGSLSVLVLTAAVKYLCIIVLNFLYFNGYVSTGRTERSATSVHMCIQSINR